MIALDNKYRCVPEDALAFSFSATTISQPVLSAQTPSWSLAAALNVSPAAISTWHSNQILTQWSFVETRWYLRNYKHGWRVLKFHKFNGIIRELKGYSQQLEPYPKVVVPKFEFPPFFPPKITKSMYQITEEWQTILSSVCGGEEYPNLGPFFLQSIGQFTCTDISQITYSNPIWRK